jgi:hypothetical protein
VTRFTVDGAIGNPTAPFVPKSCTQEFQPLSESNCAAGTTAVERQAICHDFVNGLDAADFVRTLCEQRAGDPRALCYWNVEAERVEMMPSRQEIVIAEDPSDETVQALQLGLRIFPFVGRLCRGVEVEPAGLSACYAVPTHPECTFDELGWHTITPRL